ncbi:hypothetical protein P43SY_010788 [Pythium insidiosum]|uniref:Uncharacterized protein n=1 Tax=Pythium insidiosum TaxID=114742 RepID=A0AAD5LYE9_PYTIN|nr:hypothetical protein P43SY_010788 [Pythium insidiosum]
MEAQAAQLDEWEPIRVQWAVNDQTRGRFVEALTPELVAFLDARKGQCFPLPGPWDAEDHVPTSFDTSTTGSPGPSYYTDSPPTSAASGDEDDRDEATKSDDEGKSAVATSI